MARRRQKRDHSSYTPSPSGGLLRSQMRAPLLERSRLLARRSVREMDAVRRLQVEDLRREKRHIESNFATQTYRREDGSKAPVVGREVHTHRMRKQRMPPRLRFDFQDPERTLVCQRRKIRRAVVFAMRKAGKRGRGNRKARWTAKSYISCGKR
ncbi:hypothetical protein [Chicken microvirus mg8_95]|nr:hypothetical protein [Chicken microvirus mg8_95]